MGQADTSYVVLYQGRIQGGPERPVPGWKPAASLDVIAKGASFIAGE